DQPVRSVIAATLRGCAAGKLAQNCDEGGIKNWDEQNQNRHGQNRNKAARSSAGDIYQRRASQKESNEHRSTVAHENRCGIRVVNQKPEQRGSENGEHQCLSWLAGGYKVQREKTRSDAWDAGRQTVHVVEQVDRVCNAD